LPYENPWTVLASTAVYDNPKIALVEHRVVDAAGQERNYGVLRHKESGVRVLPVDGEGGVTLVGQYRFAAGYYSWELPAGGRGIDEPPQRAAARELEEEAGLTAGQWLQLLHVVSCGSVTDETPVLFLAWDLAPGRRQPDETEVLELRREPFAEVLRMVLAGEIRDTSSVAAVLVAHLMAQRGELPEGVARHLR
jgi:8-oxo-dGTP pyrophosphatase MutT (NUDIX family)